MNILIISPVLPYGPSDGDRIRIYNIAKELKKNGHRLFLVSFIRKGEESYLPRLKPFYDAVETVKISKLKIYYNAMLSFFRMIPFNTGSYESKAMDKKVREAVKKYGIEHVFAYRLRSAQFAENIELPKSIDYVDSLALYMERSLKYEKNPAYLLYYIMDRKKVLSCERKTAAKFDSVFINSGEDRDYLNCANIIAAPNGADIKKVKARKNSVFTIGFFGNINYRPNIDGLTWFLKNIWKKLVDSDKNIRLVIAGSGGEKAAPLIAGTPAEIKGFMENIDAEAASWDVSVVPVRFGAGRQNKILQSWANGVPVVATAFTAKGVEGKDGYNLLVADTQEQFIRQIQRIKKDKALRGRLIKGGLATLKKYFSWEETGKIIDKAIKK